MYFALNQIALSKKLHDIKKIILMNHSDCGAYGGKAAFASSDAEYVTHADDLKKSKEVILGFYPNVEIKTVLAKITPEGEVSFEEIA